ncbi:MAG: hypothetical protein CME59_10225 [Halioglobus sp.]|nr:hypothetical protein [Halioglobus sp.]
MITRIFHAVTAALALGLLSACGGTPYTPAANQVAAVDLTYHVPRVDSFLVLLDTSGSMRDDDPARPKIHAAQDMVASFNSAVPEVAFNAGMVIFGKGAGSCMGNGVAKTIYGMTGYNSGEFLQALGSIDCARSTTPIVDALELGNDMLAGDEGQIAVVIFSDFRWSDPDGVKQAVAALRAQHGERLCLHTVKIGDHDSNNTLIADITANASCDSAVAAADILAPAAMTDYVASVLMAPVAIETHTLSSMALFAFDSAVLTSHGKAELAKIGEQIKGRGIKVGGVDIIGHTCDLGSEEYNQGLSERRAAAVREYLVGAGLDPQRITYTGLGELDPLVPNSSDNNRRLNRRVEIHVGTSRPQGS